MRNAINYRGKPPIIGTIKHAKEYLGDVFLIVFRNPEDESGFLILQSFKSLTSCVQHLLVFSHQFHFEHILQVYDMENECFVDIQAQVSDLKNYTSSYRKQTPITRIPFT